MAMSPQNRLRYHFTQSFQILIILAVKVLTYPTTRTKINQQLYDKLKDQPYLIIANHRRAFDPFIICSLLPWPLALKLLPISFMSHNVFYDSPLRPLMWLAGCFPARNPKGKHTIFGVEGGLKLLSQGFSLFIFPEGTRVRNQARGTAHNGVVRIHQATPHIPIIICHIEYYKGIKSWLAGRSRSIAYDIVEHPNYDDPEKLMDDVFAL